MRFLHLSVSARTFPLCAPALPPLPLPRPPRLHATHAKVKAERLSGTSHMLTSQAADAEALLVLGINDACSSAATFVTRGMSTSSIPRPSSGVMILLLPEVCPFSTVFVFTGIDLIVYISVILLQSVCDICAGSMTAPVPATPQPRTNPMCMACNTVLQRSVKLVAHSAEHTGIKPFFCPDCPSNFTRRERLEQHAAIFHARA